MFLHRLHDQFVHTKGIRIAEKTVIFVIFWHIIWQPPMVLVAKKVEKMIKIFQIFFSEKKNIKQVRKPSFIKKVQKLAILALSLQDIKNLLCQKMALTVVTRVEKFKN